MHASPAVRAAVVAACLAVLGTIAFSVYGLVFADGLCCGDDSSIAVAAKNLAQGDGYTTTIPFYEGRGTVPFDPALTTGPTLVVPAAGVILVFGPTVWAPGITTATVAFGLLGALWAVLRRGRSGTRALVYVAAFAALCVAFTPGSVFIQWAVLLGEIPAALLVVVGLAVLSRAPLRPGRVAVASALFGLAVLSKILAILLAVPALLWLLVHIVRSPKGSRARLLLASAAGAVPVVLFELVKLVSLGFSGYRDHLRDFREFFGRSSSGGTTEGGIGALVERFGDNLDRLLDTFGAASLVLGAAVAATTVLLLVRRRDAAATAQAARLSLLLAAGGATMLAYYLLVSNGIYRYALMGLLLWAAALPTFLLCRTELPLRAVAVGGLALIGLLTVDTAVDPVTFAWRDGFEPKERLRSLERVGDYLDEHRGDHQLVRGWWATSVDIEYVLDGTGEFVEVTALTPEERATRPILAINQTFSELAPAASLEQFAEDCEPVFEAFPYVVSECPPDAGAQEAGEPSG